MDSIQEGQITQEQGVDEILRTALELKTPAQVILRISCKDQNIYGRIALGAGGFIIGALVEQTGEAGYSAVRKLLSVHSGNYALLDPGRTPVPELNQTLWLKVENLLQAYPNLPETPEGMVGVNLDFLSQNVKELFQGTQVINPPLAESKITAGSTNSRLRKFDPTPRKITLILIWTIVILVTFTVALLLSEFFWKTFHMPFG